MLHASGWRKTMLRGLGRMLALCAALLALVGVFATSLAFSSSVHRQHDSRDEQQAGAAESTDERNESSPTDRTEENAAEDAEALPARHAPTEELRRLTDLASTAAQSSECWLKIETPPPRT